MLQGWRPSKNKVLRVHFCTILVSLKSNFDQKNQRINNESTETESENLLIGRDQNYAYDHNATQKIQDPNPMNRRIPVPSVSSDHYTRYEPTDTERSWVQVLLLFV